MLYAEYIALICAIFVCITFKKKKKREMFTKKEMVVFLI